MEHSLLRLYKTGVLGDPHGFSGQASSQEVPVAEVPQPGVVRRRRELPSERFARLVAAGYGCLDHEKPGAWELLGSVGRPCSKEET